MMVGLPDESDEDIDDAVSTIEDPDPCLVAEAPAGLALTWKLTSCAVSHEGGVLSARRTLEFTLQIDDPTAFEDWCHGEGLQRDSERVPFYLFEDFEGSTIGDEMVDYDSATDVMVYPAG